MCVSERWQEWAWSNKVSAAVQEPGNDHRGWRPELKNYLLARHRTQQTKNQVKVW